MLWLLATLLLPADTTAACRLPTRADTSWTLPATLAEVSGLVLAPGGQLLAHDDEHGRIIVLDTATAGALATWPLAGTPPGDYEGIALIGATAWLLQSDGTLFSFPLPAGTAPRALPVTRHATGLAERCEFEGLAAEPGGRVLLLGCKVVRAPKRGVGLRVLRWDVARRTLATPAVLEVAADTLAARTPWKRFAVSGLEVDSATRRLLLLSARQEGVLELALDGRVTAAAPLEPGRHRKAEGLTLLPGRVLLVSDEADGEEPRLTRYRCLP